MRSKTRHLDQVPVKGKADLIDIFEVVWQPEDVTRVATDLLSKETRLVFLELVYRDKVMRLDISSGTVILGRGKKADIVVNDKMASREHARIECRRDKFVLTDQSTNGTYVETADATAYLRREETTLTGEGKISFGRELAASPHPNVAYTPSSTALRALRALRGYLCLTQHHTKAHYSRMKLVIAYSGRYVLYPFGYIPEAWGPLSETRLASVRPFAEVLRVIFRRG